MDKNTLVGFVLIGAVIVGFSIYSRPSQEEMERAQHYHWRTTWCNSPSRTKADG